MQVLTTAPHIPLPDLQVGSAVDALSRLQLNQTSAHSTSLETLAAYHEKRAAALSDQEVRIAEAQQLVAQERSSLQALAASLKNSMDELSSSQGSEKARLAAEAQRLAVQQVALESQRAALAAEVQTERQRLDEWREQRAREEQQAGIEREGRRAEVRAEEATMARERERFARERAAAVMEAATREAQATSEVQRHEMERELMAETRKRLAAERAAVEAQMAELDEAKAAFASDVEALKALGLQVQAESFSVRQTMEQAHAKMAEATRLREEANAALEAVEAEKQMAEAAMAKVQEGRKAFELERLETAKERKQLASEKVALSRSTEATRLLQLQLVTSMTSPLKDSAHTGADAASPEGTAATVAAAAAAAAAAAPAAAPAPAPATRYDSDEGERRPTPERTWRQWVKPNARPQRIASTVPVPATRSLPATSTTPAPAPTPLPPVAEVEPPSVPPQVDAATSGQWQQAWREDYAKAAALLREQSGFIRALQSGSNAPPTGGSASLAATAPSVAFAPRPGACMPPARMPPPASSGRPSLASAGTAPQTPYSGASGWSPASMSQPTAGGLYVGTDGRSASIGASTTTSSRLSYQFPTALSLGTPLFSDSNASTPSRLKSNLAGGLRGSQASLYAAGAHAASNAWPRTFGAMGVGGLESSSSSTVSLHNVRLSSWGSLPSRSSDSPAHPPSYTAAADAATDAATDVATDVATSVAAVSTIDAATN